MMKKEEVTIDTRLAGAMMAEPRTCRVMEVVRELLKDPTINMLYKNKNGESHLHRAVVLGDSDIIKELIFRGAIVDFQSKQGWAPLHVAAYNGLLRPLKILIAKGATVNLQDQVGWSPLHYAAAGGHAETIRTLIDKGAQVNLLTHEFKNAIYVAAERGYVDCLELLVSCGADATIRDNTGRSAIRVAKTPEIRTYLKDAMSARETQINEEARVAAALKQQEEEGLSASAA